MDETTIRQPQVFFPHDAFQVNATARSIWDQIKAQGGGGWATTVPLSQADLCNPRPLSAEGKSQMLHEELPRMRNLLRETWAVTDLRRKEWKIFQLRVKFHQMTVSSEEQMNEPPPDSLMDYALSHLTRIAHNAKVCENQECRRYFIAERRTKRHCSDDCYRYWDLNKDEINETRRQKYLREKGGTVRQYNRSHRPAHVQLSQQEIENKIMGWCANCDSVFTTIRLSKPDAEVSCPKCGVATQYVKEWVDEDWDSIRA